MSEEIVSLEFPGDPTKLATKRELPLGVLEFEIKGHSTERHPESGKVSVVSQLQVVAPEDYRGITAFHRTWIGTNTDPTGREKATWDKNAYLLMQMLKESGVVFTPNTKLVEAMGASINQHVLGEVKVKPGNIGKDGRKWEDQHVIRSFTKVGSKPVNVRTDNELGFGGGAPAPVGPSPTERFSQED